MELLVRSGREPIKQLATAVGLSRSALSVRLKRLESDGIIRGYAALLSDQVSSNNCKAILMVRVRKTPAYDVVKSLRKIPGVVSCHSVSGGDVDLILQLATASVAELNEARDNVAAAKDVIGVVTYVILATNFDSR